MMQKNNHESWAYPLYMGSIHNDAKNNHSITTHDVSIFFFCYTRILPNIYETGKLTQLGDRSLPALSSFFYI
jgi:hypothetical protein